MKKFITSLILFCTLSVFAGEQAENVIYIGSGSAKSGDPTVTSNKSPFTLGYLKLSNTVNSVWGVDFSGEGTLLDSTWGQNQAVKQATSFNLLLGKNIGKTENSRFDASLILGMRHKTKSCPSSYLGFQCYADSKPDVSYGFNSGVALTWSYSSVLVGVRATGESTQLMLGYRF